MGRYKVCFHALLQVEASTIIEAENQEEAIEKMDNGLYEHFHFKSNDVFTNIKIIGIEPID